MSQTVFTLGSALRLALELDEPRFGLRPEDLFGLAVRQNPNRAFLFVSKVLGKHLPMGPAVLPAAGRLLSLALEGETDPGPWAGMVRGDGGPPFAQAMEELERGRTVLGPEERTLFIGFAETATGLARAVAACYAGEAAYIGTTRYPLAGCEPLTFEESHSHAKTHLLHIGPGETFPARCRRAVIVDDEFTTGNTALKLVEVLHRRFGIRRFTLLSLLDWTDGAGRRAMADRLGVEIGLVSLLHGSIQSAGSQGLPELVLDDRREDPGRPLRQGPAVPDGLGLASGRTLMTAEDQARDRRLCREIARRLGPAGPDALFLGTGELIYGPALVAGYCGAAAFHSTTQSPVYPLAGSAVERGVRFLPPDTYSSAGYLYNVPADRYRRAVLFSERETRADAGLGQLGAYLADRGVGDVEVVLL